MRPPAPGETDNPRWREAARLAGELREEWPALHRLAERTKKERGFAAPVLDRMLCTLRPLELWKP